MTTQTPSRTRRDGSPLRPLVFGKHMRADIETVMRLEHLFSLGLRYREQAGNSEDEAVFASAHEQLEAVAAECCELFGFDPDSDDYFAETSKEIVLYGRDVCETIEVINESLALRRYLQSTGELSDGD